MYTEAHEKPAKCGLSCFCLSRSVSRHIPVLGMREGIRRFDDKTCIYDTHRYPLSAPKCEAGKARDKDPTLFDGHPLVRTPGSQPPMREPGRPTC